MNNQQYSTYQNQNQGNNWTDQQTQGNNWHNQGTQGNNWYNQGIGRAWYNNTQNQNNEGHQDQNNGRGLQATCFICREDIKQKISGIVQKIQPEWWNNILNSHLIQTNMGNHSQDVRNQNNNTQNRTQNKTEAVTRSNQEESDEASVEYILTMVDMEIESTTPEAASFEDEIKEDDDQENIEEEDNNDICLFEFEEKELFANDTTC